MAYSLSLQDGTINYLLLPAVTDGLRFLVAYLPFIPLRLTTLLNYIATSINAIRHDVADTPVVRILSRLPTRRMKSLNDKAETGSIISLVFLTVRTFF